MSSLTPENLQWAQGRLFEGQINMASPDASYEERMASEKSYAGIRDRLRVRGLSEEEVTAMETKAVADSIMLKAFSIIIANTEPEDFNV